MYNKLQSRHSASASPTQFALLNQVSKKRDYSKGREYESSTETLRNASHDESRRVPLHGADPNPPEDKLKSLITQVSAGG